MEPAALTQRRKGRAALSNRSGRFEATQREPDAEALADTGTSTQARLHVMSSTSIISYNASPDLGFDRTINSYKGCEHGCIYCYARPAHTYLGHSAGLDFETEIYHKPDAVCLLRKALAAPRYRPATIVMGGDTDVYQPVEEKLRLTRALLQVLGETHHPVSIVTKSARILRDIDILQPMAARGLAHVAISLTTLDARLSGRMEPRACSPKKRLTAISELARAHIPVTVMVAPVIPAINDHEVEHLLTAARDAGATAANYVLLRLPHEVAPLFREWLEAHYPQRAARVMSLIGQMRGGRDYDANWFQRGRGEGPLAALLHQRFTRARARLGLAGRLPALRTDLFRPPAPDGQGDLFNHLPANGDLPY